MAKVAEYLQVGNRENMSIEELLRLLETAYRDLAIQLNKKPDIYQRTTDGQTTDVFLNNGDININTNTLKVEMLTEHSTATAVVWTQLSP